MRAFFNVISTLFAILTLFFASSCSSSDPGRKTPAAESPDTKAAKEEPAKEPEMVFEGPGELLPRDISGWAISSPPRYFGPENLYDLINGGAEIYVEFGLEKMVTAEYRKDGVDGLSVTAEVYDMGGVLGAFGRTARFLEGQKDPSKAGVGLPEGMASRGILGDGDLVVWKDGVLVHLTLMDERPDATADSIGEMGRKVLPMVAGSILSRVEDAPSAPEVFGLFPEEKRMARTEAWHPTDLMGISGLGKGFSVRYTDGDVSWTAFATVEMDEKAVSAAWERAKGAEADGRRLVARPSGKRLVGLTLDAGEMDEAGFEKRAGELMESFKDR